MLVKTYPVLQYTYEVTVDVDHLLDPNRVMVLAKRIGDDVTTTDNVMKVELFRDKAVSNKIYDRVTVKGETPHRYNAEWYMGGNMLVDQFTPADLTQALYDLKTGIQTAYDAAVVANPNMTMTEILVLLGFTIS